MDRNHARRSGQIRIGGGRCFLLTAAVGVLWFSAMPATRVEARKYKQRVRAQDECKTTYTPTQAETDKARRYYESAIIYYDTKDYLKAREEFQGAYDTSKDPEFLINLSAVAAKQQQYKDSIKFLEQYIEQCPNAPDTFAARSRVDDLRIAQAIQEGEKPTQKMTVRLPPTAALALMGAGVGAVIIGAGLGGGALADARRLDNPANQNRVYDAELQGIAARGESLQNAGIVFDVVGGAALAAGIIWTLVWNHQRDGLSLTLAPKPGGMLVGGTF